METASLLPGIAVGDEVCEDDFIDLEEYQEELENNKNVLDDCVL